MPTYEYECEQCGVRFERLQRMTDPSLTDCPECGGHVHRVMQPVGVIFKGSGFYVTDNKGKSSTGIPGGKKKEEEARPADAKADTSKSAPVTGGGNTASPATGSAAKKDD